MKVRVMRGLPGSGKTHFSSKILPKIFNIEEEFVSISSADNFFMKNGVYRFNPKQLPYAHKSCRKKFLTALQSAEEEHLDLVIVDNTNTTPTEIAFYYDLATIYTNDVEILTIEPPAIMSHKDWLDQCCAKNAHGVPMKSITAMADRMQKNKLPWFWKEKMITREDGFFILNGIKHMVD